MRKKVLFLMFLAFVLSTPAMARVFPWQISLQLVNPNPTPIHPNPPISPFSLDTPLPCDIEAYQTETGVEIDANEVSLVGFYRIAVMGPREMMYYNSVLLNDGFSVFISTATWPEGTYLLYIEIPGGWLEGEFEIED